MSSISTAGLVGFVAFILAAVGALNFDLYRAVTGETTITEWATAAPWRAALIVAGCAVGVVCLAVHFLFFGKGSATQKAAVLLMLAFGASPGVATDGPFPASAPTPAPPPPPVPVPAGTVLTLTPDLLYVFSDANADLVAQPAGLVTVTKVAGPITFKGRFAGGTGAVETRTLPGPWVYSVEPVAKASGRVHLALIREGRKVGDPIPTTIVDVGTASPSPTPPPQPQPKPVDPPAPTPEPTVRGAWVIVIQDESVAAPAVLSGPTLAKLVASGRGHVYGTTKDATKISAKKYDALLTEAGVTGSGLIVLDKAGAKVLAVPLPATDADLAGKLKGVVPGF